MTAPPSKPAKPRRPMGKALPHRPMNYEWLKAKEREAIEARRKLEAEDAAPK